MPELIYCADGNKRFAEIAIQHGFTYGARLPARGLHLPPEFTDQDWKKPDRTAYMAAVEEHRPRLATVLDFEREDQAEEVLDWAVEAAGYVKEAVLVIPKVSGIVPWLPRRLNGREIRLAFSVPTAFGATDIDPREFGDWPTHLLGGSPDDQQRYARMMNVVSADTNQGKLYATHMSAWLNRPDRYRPQMSALGYQDSSAEMQYLAFRITQINMRAMWLRCPAWLRPALVDHIPGIKTIANQYKSELGFVNSAALKDSIERGGLWVACIGQKVIGFVNYRARRDGWNVIYEIAVSRAWRGQRIGTSLLQAVPLPRRLKCTEENSANEFYSKTMELVATEPGRKRALNVWQAA